MDFWPKDDRNTSSRQRTAKTTNRDYPYLEPGLIGAARLLNTHTKGLQWDFLIKNSSKEDSLRQRLNVGQKFELFPPTRSTRPPTTSRTNVQQRAEHGANFLRTYLPDVDITADLIREHLTEEGNLARRLQQFDHLSGNVLNVLLSDTPDENILLFPVGELACDLNISLMRCKSESELVFKRWNSPTHTYPTPIRQIESSHCAGRGVIAVRTFGDTYISTINRPKDDAEAYSMMKVGSLHTSSRQLVDIHISRNGIVTTVTENGSVLQYDVSAPRTMRIETSQQLSAAMDVEPDYWRLLPSLADDTLLLMSTGSLSQIDMRSKPATPIFSLPDGRHVLTFAEKQAKNYVSMISTKELIWLDTRFTNRPLLSLSHGRQYDRTLQLFNLCSTDDQQLCVVHSRFNSMVSIYDVSKTQDQPLHVNDAPYFLPFETLYNESVSKAMITHHNGHELLFLGQDGRVSQYPLRFPPQSAEIVDVKMVGHCVSVDLFSDEVNQLSQRFYSQVDVSESSVLYGVKQAHLADPEEIRHTTDQFPRYLQSKELPTETILTAYDLAFLSGTEPEQFSRSDFLASSSIKSEEAFQALLDGKFASSLIKAPFKASISDTISKLGTPHTHNPQKLYDYLKSIYLDESTSSHPNHGQQHNACRQLALDLALSSTVLHECAISTSQGDVQDLETMAGALSLGDEPPPYMFGYLKPLEGFSKTSYDEDRKPLESPDLPIGARLLMKTWDYRTPYEYEYHDPYAESSTSVPKKNPSRTPDNPSLNIEPAQLYPPIITVAMPPTLVVKPSQKPKLPTSQSQDIFATRFGAESGSQPLELSQNLGSSQTPFANTQVVPGPFGGRPQLKKKPAKKRIGGF